MNKLREFMNVDRFFQLLFGMLLLTGCTLDMNLAELPLDSLAPIQAPPSNDPGPVGPLPGHFPLANKTKYSFAFPLSVELTPEGHLLVTNANETSMGVQEYDPATDELVLGFGANGTADNQLQNPVRAVLHNNLIYVLAGNSYKVFDRNGNFQSKVGSSGFANGQLDSPTDLTIDKNGLIYIADCGNNRVQVFNPNGTFNKNIGLGWGTGDGQIKCPYGLYVDDSLNVFVTDYNNHRVQKFNSSGTFSMKFGVAGNGVGQLQQPARVSVDSLGNIYISEASRKEIIKFSSTGTYIATYKGDTGGHDAIGVAYSIFFDANDSIYIADGDKKRIELWDKNGVYQKSFADYPESEKVLAQPTGLWIDSQNNFYVAQSPDNTKPQGVVKFDPQGNYLTTVGSNAAGPGQLQYAFDSAVDSDGNIFVVDTNQNKILKFSADGTYLLTLATVGSGPGQLDGPGGIHIDKDDNIYVVEINNHRVQKMDKTGAFIKEIGNSGGPGQLSQPVNLFVDKDGNIFVADVSLSKILKYDAAGNFLFSFGNGPSYGVYANEAGFIFATNYSTNQVDKYDSGGNYITSFGQLGSAIGQFTVPVDIAGDSYGNIYVVDLYNRRVQKFNDLGIPLLE
ncbi:6-bladed beta-propeller [Bdellovibrio sp. BCCA]|uniref:6-bladed beta-propeller n=1 Tax=Bdellovibrio sp. BCCA TaxID=3136281 RepID=UPI0030F2E002